MYNETAKIYIMTVTKLIMKQYILKSNTIYNDVVTQYVMKKKIKNETATKNNETVTQYVIK